MISDIRPSPIAGTWYPGNASALRNALDSYLGDAPPQVYEPLLGVLAPHAGMRFSGGVAGKAFRYLKGKTFEFVVIIAPSHYPYPAALISTAHGAYQTPLGKIPVAKELLAELRQKIDLLLVRDDPEHAIEIELPFLQHTLASEFHLLPLAMVDQSLEVAQDLAQSLAEVLEGKHALLVASSDLSHFYDQKTANRLDHAVLEAVAAYQPLQIIELEAEKRGFACGRGAIATVMLVAQQRGATIATIEGYGTSGDINGDYSRVVGYGAATFHN